MGKISHSRQLEVWQEAHKLVLMVYQMTKKLPRDERFGLVAQMRRAARPHRQHWTSPMTDPLLPTPWSLLLAWWAGSLNIYRVLLLVFRPSSFAWWF